MLKAIVDQETYDGLSEDIQEHYTEKEGSHFLGVTSVNGIELTNSGKLKKALTVERDAHTKAANELKAFEGIDVDEAKDALAKVGEMDDWDPDKKLVEHKEQFEAQLQKKYELDRTKLVAKHTSEMETLTSASKQLSGQLRETMIRSTATQAIAKANGSQELLLPLVEGMTRMRQLEDGRFITEVLDGDGSARLSSAAGSTEPMSIDELVVSLREDEKFSCAFKGSGASGSGSTGSEGTKGGAFKLSREDAFDTAKYQAAKAEAEKAGRTLELGT